jgi:hypothetical protein
VSCCGTTIHSTTIIVARGNEVPSDGGVVVMGIDRVTMLHPREMGKPDLHSPLEVASPPSVGFLENSMQ